MSNNSLKLIAVAFSVVFVAGLAFSTVQEAVVAETPEARNTTPRAQMKEDKIMSAPIYEFKATTLTGDEISLDKYKGDVLLIVNTASKCGYTPQYEGLEELHKKYSGKGLRVLGFPCNQFGGQEPGDSNEIGAFCQKNYGVDFQMFEKIDVNGKDAHPLYKYLTHEAKGALGTEAIKWNFTKFLVDRNGEVLKRYAPTVKPEEIAPDIEKELAVAQSN